MGVLKGAGDVRARLLTLCTVSPTDSRLRDPLVINTRNAVSICGSVRPSVVY